MQGRNRHLREVVLSMHDARVMTHRNLVVWSRTPANIFFTILQPLVFMLLFRYVFGGAIPIGRGINYADYLVPGIVVQACAFNAFGTALTLVAEMKRGSIDRFHTMPIARSSVLLGRLGADTIRLSLTIAALLAAGYAVGFRFHNGWLAGLGMIALALAIGIVVACAAAFSALLLRHEETVQAFSFLWLFPLTFASSAFVPVETMPGWLQAFADHQPFTVFANEARSLALGGPTASGALRSGAWLLGLGALFFTACSHAFKSK